jgi:alpha-amylase
LKETNNEMSLFDSSLHNNFCLASNKGNNYDLRRIFDETLVGTNPTKAVTVVANHDTQPLQSLEAPVEAWFKPLAYALILLRDEGYPCVFYPDLYGAHYTGEGQDGNQYEIWLAKVDELETMLHIRRNNAFGAQRDYFDHPNCIGWTREGDSDHGVVYKYIPAIRNYLQ